MGDRHGEVDKRDCARRGKIQKVRPGTGLHTCACGGCIVTLDPSGNLGRAFVDEMNRSARRQHTIPGYKPCSVRAGDVRAAVLRATQKRKQKKLKRKHKLQLEESGIAAGRVINERRE